MAALSFAAAVRAFADGDRAPTWYLTGDEDVLKQEFIEKVLDGVLEPSTRDFNLDVRQAGDLSGESLHALVETPPMLAEQRVVVLRGLEQWRRNAKVWEVLHHYLAQPNPSTLLVLVHGAGEKPDTKIVKAAARHVDLKTPSPRERAAWVAKRAKALGTTIDAEAIEHLLTTVDADLGHAARELEKLVAAADGPITLALVQDMVGVRRGETLPDWVDALLLRDAARGVNLVNIVLQQSGITGVRMVMALGTGLLGTRLARGLLDRGMAAKAVEQKVKDAIGVARPNGLRQWGVEAAVWTGAATRWTAAELDDALGRAYDADGSLKNTTVTDERGILVSLTLSLARVERAA